MEKKHLVSVKNSKISFNVQDASQTILDAAITANIMLPHGCKSGACGSCITKLIKGNVQTKNGKLISENNSILLCQSFPKSNKIILEYISDKLQTLKERNNNHYKINPKELLLQVVANKSVTPMVKELSLFVPFKLNFKFLPGSHMELFYSNKTQSRKYSIINAPNNSMNLKNNIIKFLIVNHNKDGLSKIIHNKIKSGDLLTLKGPYSSFHYSIKKNEPVIGIAGGTGISPILSIVKDLLKKNNNLNALVYLSVRNRNEILEMDTLCKLKAKHKNFSFKITLSREIELPNSTFLYGRVHATLQKVFKDLSTHKVLIAGSDMFVDAAYNHVINLKAIKENIFYEKFSEN